MAPRQKTFSLEIHALSTIAHYTTEEYNTIKLPVPAAENQTKNMNANDGSLICRAPMASPAVFHDIAGVEHCYGNSHNILYW